MNHVKNQKPKYNMHLGLTQVKGFYPENQVKFYREYLNHLKDNNLLVVVLKKALQRCGSLGFIDDTCLNEAMGLINMYEGEFLVKGTSREVEFTEIQPSEVIDRNIKFAVNLLGIQGDNCQATFHHRMIFSLNNINVVQKIATAAINHAAEEYILSEDLADRLLTSIVQYAGDVEDTLVPDHDYTRFD